MTGGQMVAFEEALRIVDRTLAGARLPTGTVAVRDALGLTLQTDQHARVDLPPFNKSAMDGYAILEGDERETYRLLGTVPAGRTCPFTLSPGTSVKVMTGAPVPDRTARVVRIEDTDEHDGTVTVHRHSENPNICVQAEDVRTGEIIMSAGITLGPLEIANLVSCGITEVEAARGVRVAVISTGDEIVDSADLLESGKIMNVNGPMLAALSKAFALDLVSEESLPDERERTARAIRAALERADIVVASGGVSVGDFDFVLDALADVGLTLHFSQVAIKPGRPTVYATAGRKAFFGLPGNPVSSYLMFHLFVLRAARRMSGGEVPWREFTLRMGAEFRRRKADRTEFVPARLTPEGLPRALEYHGSAHLLALMEADGFLVVPPDVAEIGAGEPVTFVPLGRIAEW